jgi:addiction module HigA family antidote
MSNYICARPIHPGELLKEEIEYRGLSQIQLAEKMGISYKILNDILNERRPLTANTAMLFEAAMNLPANMLMGMQFDYNMQVAKNDKSFSERLAKIRQMAAML